jgi:hypothetical protein
MVGLFPQRGGEVLKEAKDGGEPILQGRVQLAPLPLVCKLNSY